MRRFAKSASIEYWNGYVAHAAVRLAAEFGWSTNLIGAANGRLEIECGGTHLQFLDFGLPAGLEPTTPHPDASKDVVIVPSPPEISLRAFGETFGCDGGVATVIAPVGRYGSHVEMGMIDAVTIPYPGRISRDTAWSVDVVSVGHSRCWVTAASICPDRPHDPGEVAISVRRSRSLTCPSPIETFIDTAQLCEAMLDEGWPSGLFPRPVIMATSVENDGTRVKGWIAATEGSTIVSIAHAIGDRIAGIGNADERRLLLEDAWKTTGRRA